MALNNAAEIILPIPIHQIQPSSHQARKTFHQGSIQALAESMDHEGLIHPITVRRVASSKFQVPSLEVQMDSSDNLEFATCHFELISGERRLRAAKFLGWETIPARVITVVSEGEAAAKSLIENLQRENLDPIEEAEGFAQLNKVDPAYWTQERIAQIVGKERTYVTRSLGLLNLPEGVRDDVRHSTLTRGHAIELLRLAEPDAQLKAAKKITNLSVQQTRNFVDRVLGVKSEESRKQKLIQKSAQTARDIAEQERLGNPDPLEEVWARLSSADSLIWKAFYEGNWSWQFNLDLSSLWAMTAPPISVPKPELERRRARELRNILSEWFNRLSQELKKDGDGGISSL